MITATVGVAMVIAATVGVAMVRAMGVAVVAATRAACVGVRHCGFWDKKKNKKVLDFI